MAKPTKNKNKIVEETPEVSHEHDVKAPATVAKSGVVKMKFKEHKYYNDMDIPMFEAGKTYELEGAEWIQRWIKRGGIIVEGELQQQPHVVDESVLVDTPVAPSEEQVEDNKESGDTQADEEL